MTIADTRVMRSVAPITGNEGVLATLGLGGDGDEMFAIRDVENSLGITLDYADAPKWVTVGDVFASACRAIACDAGDNPELWKRFAIAITNETDVDPDRIAPETLLLSPSTWRATAVVLAIVLGAGAALFGLWH